MQYDARARVHARTHTHIYTVYLYNTYAEHRCSFSTSRTRHHRSVGFVSFEQTQSDLIRCGGQKRKLPHIPWIFYHIVTSVEKNKIHTHSTPIQHCSRSNCRRLNPGSHHRHLALSTDTVAPTSPPCRHCFPNHIGHPDGSTRRIGSFARVCATLDWIPTPVRLVQPPFGFHAPVTPSTPTPMVIFVPKHHLRMRSFGRTPSCWNCIFLIFCPLCFSGLTFTMSKNIREGRMIAWIHALVR
jgi:hypothetical protein